MARLFQSLNTMFVNPRQYARIGTFLMLFSTVFILLVVIFANYNMQRVQQGWKEYHDITYQEELFISNVTREIGYDGMIHHFKNYVLRHDDVHKDAFLKHADMIERLLNERAQFPKISDLEVQDIKKIDNTVQQYRDKISIVDEMYAQGFPVTEIDRAVKVDDSEAVAALLEMQGIFLAQEKEIYNRANDLQNLVMQINLATLILLPFLFIAAFMKYRIFSLLVENIQKKTSMEQRLAAIVDNTLEGMITANERGEIEEFNIACEKMFGWTREEIIGKNLNTLMTGEHKQAHDGYIRNYLSGGGAKLIGQPREFEVVKKDGTKFFVEVSLAEFFAGEKRYFTGIVRDLTDRKTQERELRAVIDAMPALVSFLDTDMVYSFVNKTYRDYWKKGSDEIVGMSIDDLVGTDAADTIRPYLKKALEGETVGYEKTLVLPTGERHFHANYIPRYDAMGNITGVLAVVHDITERKQKELDLQKYKEQTQLLVQAIESCQVGISLADPHSENMPLTFVNKAFEDITGYSREEVLGQNCRFLQGPKTTADSVEGMRDAIAERRSINMELLNYRKNGTTFWNNINLSPVYGEDGALKAYVGTQNDITALKEAEGKIRQERDFTRHLIEFSPSPVVGLDANGNTNFVNQAALNVIKYKADEVIGKNWWKEFYPKDDGQVEKLFTAFEKNEGQVKDHEMTLTDKLGEEHLIAWTSINQLDEDGNLVQIVGAGTDLTKERERAKTEQERHKLESLGTMAGGIAHEINNALSPILLLSEEHLRKNQNADEDTRADLETVIDYALHARSIVEDVLLYSRQTSRDMSAYPIEDLCEQSMRFSRDLLPATIQVDEDMQQELRGRSIVVNSTGFVQIMSNLLNNASHAMKGEGIIRVNIYPERRADENTVLESDEYLRIDVIDTGHGIAESQIGNIFDPFFTTKREGEGSGLGLSVVYGMMKEWGGEITVVSEEDRGATFSLMFPLVAIDTKE